MVGYADDHTLLTTIPHKDDRVTAAAQLNADLAALCKYGHHWNIKFAPSKTFSLVVSLKSDISNHPALFLDGIQISDISSVKALGFVFDSSLTWQKHIDQVLSRGKQRLGQLYRGRSLFGCEGTATLYKSWIRPTLEYGSILYSGAALSHLNRLERLQARVENMCGLEFPSLTTRRNALILGLTCIRVSYRLHSSDPASHLRLQNPCNFHTLDRFHRSWQAVVVNLWDSIPADILLRGESDRWRTVLKDIQKFIMYL